MILEIKDEHSESFSAYENKGNLIIEAVDNGECSAMEFSLDSALELLDGLQKIVAEMKRKQDLEDITTCLNLVANRHSNLLVDLENTMPMMLKKATEEEYNLLYGLMCRLEARKRAMDGPQAK